jgi:PKD repeat protein
MGSDDEEIVIRLDGKRLIGIFLIMVLAIFVLGTYVNAMIAYHPNTVSMYFPPPPPPIINQPPIADAGSSQNVFINEIVYFDGSRSKDNDGSIASYSWDFGDGSSAAGIKVSHAYASEGAYTVTLTVTDNLKATSSTKVIVTVSTPTPEDMEKLSPKESATILANLTPKASLEILTGLNTTMAADIAEELNTTALQKIVEAAVNINRTSNISGILLEMEKEHSADVLLNLDPDTSLKLLETMKGIDVKSCANVVETAFLLNPEHSADLLESMKTETLLELLVEISRLPSSPSTAAAIIEVLSTEKTLELARVWISLGDVQEFGNVLRFLTSKALNRVFGNLTMPERVSLYPYLSGETTSLIQRGLLPLPDIALTSLTVTRVDSRAYNLTMSIRNQGNVETGVFKVQIKIDNTLIKQIEVSNLSADHSTTSTFEWKPKSKGAYSLEAILDSENLVEEIDEENNRLTKTYGVELPDLAVAFKTVPTKLVEGNTYVLEIEISNIGEEEALNFNLTLQGSGIVIEEGKVRWVSFSLGSSDIKLLPQGSSEDIDFTWKPEIAGEYTFTAKADPEEHILEGDRTNNEAQWQFEIEERAKLWPYLLIIAVSAIAVVGILLLVRPKTFSFLSRLRANLFRNYPS